MLSYQYQPEPTATRMTGFAGLLPYLDLACLLGVLEAVDKEVGITGSQGWLDRQHVLALVLLNLAGGDCMDDIRLLEADEGLSRMVQEAERYGLGRGERRAWQRRFRKGRGRTFPSPSRLCEWLERFHDADQERARVEGHAFIPTPNAHLEGLGKVNETLLAAVQRHAPCREATLDIDATIQQTHKREAFICYQGYRAYQPLNVYWAEMALLVYSQFRDGNVPAHCGILEALKASLEALPAGVETVWVRMDSAGYQHEVMRYCATGDGGKRDPIGFSIGTDLTREFRAAIREVSEEEWQPLPRVDGVMQEWAEVVYVPDALTRSRQAPEYRYLAIRERVAQGVLPGMTEGAPPKLPFATEVLAGVSYRLSGIVTNRTEEGAELIHWHHQRCGKSEEAHAILKTDLGAEGTFPSGKFGANAAWWAIVVLAANLHAALRRLALPSALTPKRMKALRFALIAVPGRVVARGRQLFVRLAREHPALGWLTEMRRKLRTLAPASA